MQTRGQLLHQARQDANWTVTMVAEKSRVNEEKLKALESDNSVAILDAKVSTADLRRLEKLFKFPEETLFAENNSHLHRMVVFQRITAPQGFHTWVDLLDRFVSVHLIPDENGTYDSYALAKLRRNIEDQLKTRVLKLMKDGSITEGRAKELLNMSVWDDF